MNPVQQPMMPARLAEGSDLPIPGLIGRRQRHTEHQVELISGLTGPVFLMLNRVGDQADPLDPPR